MSVLDRLLGSDSNVNASVIYECRRCGTSLEPDVTLCPECGACDVARYEF